MPKFAYKIFNNGSDTLLAVSDADIVGRKLVSEGMEVTVSDDFYSGSQCDENRILELVQNASIVNAIGREIIDLLVKNGFVSRENILLIGEVPHAQIISIK